MVLLFRHETERILTSSCSENTKTYIFEGLIFGADEKSSTPYSCAELLLTL